MASTVDQAEFVFAKAEAQRSATLIQVAALAGAALCIVLAASLQEPINRQRRELQLVLQSDLYSELPPKYAWVSAAGGTFRGVAAAFLWTRAENLKQEGKYYELHQLAKWICTLQPRFAQVWAFQSWNMAYNISVATHSTRERWQWVYNGIRLLRDEGIPNNEKAMTLYHQLAWTWFHKVGDRLDDYQLKYKRIWATTMEVLLGSPPAGLTDEEQVNYLQPVADAPHRLDVLLARRPGVRPLVEQLADLGIDVEVGTDASRIFHPLEQSFFKPYTAYLVEKKFSAYRKTPQAPDEQTTRLRAFFDSAPPEDFAALLAYLRSKVLREQYKMDPDFMQQMTGMLGTDKPLPIDWRTPWSQALYWSIYGTMKGRGMKNAKEFDLLNTDRVTAFSIGQIARQGKYVFRPKLDQPEESFLDMSPDYRYVEAIHQICLKLGKLNAREGEDLGNTAGEDFRDFHINTLHSAILGLYLSGREAKAREYYEYLAKNYPDQFTGKTKEMYLGTFHDFMQQQIKEMAGSQQETLMLIYSNFERAYLALGNGQHDEYAAKARYAFDLYRSYQKDKADDPQGRRTLPPFAQLQADALYRYVTQHDIPLLMRFAVWDRETKTEVKYRCYDFVRQKLEEIYGKTDLNIDKAFPPPPGMNEWRATHPVDTPEELARKAAEEKERKRLEEKGK